MRTKIIFELSIINLFNKISSIKKNKQFFKANIYKHHITEVIVIDQDNLKNEWNVKKQYLIDNKLSYVYKK